MFKVTKIYSLQKHSSEQTIPFPTKSITLYVYVNDTMQDNSNSKQAKYMSSHLQLYSHT